MRPLSKFVLGLAVAASLPVGLYGCGMYEFRNVTKVASSVDVLETNWRGEVRYIEAHGVMGGNTGLDIRLVNDKTGQSVTIAYGAGAEGTLASRSPGEIEITVPNEGNVTYYDAIVPDIKIVMHFTPRNDPERRAAWFAWYWDKKAEANRAWYCKEYLPSLPPWARKQTNHMLAYVIHGADGSDQTCCPD